MTRSLLLFFLGLFFSQTQLQLEIVFLRKQLETAYRASPKPRIKRFGRLFFSIMTDLFGAWKDALRIVKPETVIRWHRQGFKLYWTWKSRHKSGRPKIPQEQIILIRRPANGNPLWGAPHIHGEMLNLGFDISESTVLRYMPKKDRRPNGQRWKMFLGNHAFQIIALDFFVVPTLTFRLLYVLVFLSHDRRRIIQRLNGPHNS